MGWPPLSLRHIDVTVVASNIFSSRAVIAALLGFGLGLSPDVPARALDKQALTFITHAGQHKITVEVADDENERNTGLMFRQSIGDDEGMIFLYNHEEDVSMWMKNTYISLDMIF